MYTDSAVGVRTAGGISTRRYWSSALRQQPRQGNERPSQRMDRARNDGGSFPRHSLPFQGRSLTTSRLPSLRSLRLSPVRDGPAGQAGCHALHPLDPGLHGSIDGQSFGLEAVVSCRTGWKRVRWPDRSRERLEPSRRGLPFEAGRPSAFPTSSRTRFDVSSTLHLPGQAKRAHCNTSRSDGPARPACIRQRCHQASQRSFGAGIAAPRIRLQQIPRI